MTEDADRRELPLRHRFSGRIGRTYHDSEPDWPQQALAPDDAPHVLVVLLDDVGFGHPATFGGPVEMPTLQRLADGGLRYNQFHTVGICSPTRAALLTGRNHHSVGHGAVQRLGYPGYSGGWPRDAATVAETLRLNGYATGAFGKWHNTPNGEQSELGPFDSWPTSVGFDRFYGFHGGDCNQWEPPLVDNTTFVDRPGGGDYHLTEDLADRTIDWFLQQRQLFPHRPVFMYFAPGAAHAPHHAPRDYIDRYRGTFDHGWDRDRELTFERQLRLGVVPEGTELTPRPDAIPAWDSLSEPEQRVFARLQEAFAGMLEHTDHQIGRIVDAIEDAGELDNTVVFYIVGDNGPAAETGLSGALNEYAYMNHVEHPIEEMERRIDEIGGPMTFNSVPAGWSWAGSAPFQWLKQIASHYGATRNPLVVHWGDKLPDRGGLRSQFHHVIDIAPTILELAGLPEPEAVHGTPQRSFDGTSLAYSFDADGPSRRRRQYFEVWGSRSLYDDGWLAGMRNPRLPWEFDEGTVDFTDDAWELYHVEEDFSQAQDLAEAQPDRLNALRSLWYAEAERNGVLPLEFRRHGATKGSRGLPPRHHFVFDRPVRRLPAWLAPDVGNRSHTIRAGFVSPASGIEGTIVSLGGRFGGYGLFVIDGHLVYAYNLFDLERTIVTATDPVPAGGVVADVRFEADERKPGTGGVVTLSLNGREVGNGRVERTTAYHYSTETVFNIGESFATPVIEAVELPFRFTGDHLRVEFFLHGDAPDVSAERERVLRAAE